MELLFQLFIIDVFGWTFEPNIVSQFKEIYNQDENEQTEEEDCRISKSVSFNQESRYGWSKKVAEIEWCWPHSW